MTNARRWWSLDIVLSLALLTAGTYGIWFGVGTFVRVLLALPLVVFLPGYAFVCVLFPGGGAGPTSWPPFDDPAPTYRGRSASSIDPLERIVLSVVLSVAIVALAVLAVNLSPLPISKSTVLAAVAATTFVLLAVATIRRALVPANERFALSLSALPAPFFAPNGHRFDDSRWDVKWPNLAIVVGVLLLASSVGYALANPPQSPAYTEFGVQGKHETANTKALYRDTYTRGQTATLGTVVTNHEGSATRYTVVAVLQRVDRSDGSITVRSARVIGRTSVRVADGDRKRVPVKVTPSMSGTDLRIVLYLYRGKPPSDGRSGAAYRTLRLAVTVRNGGGSN